MKQSEVIEIISMIDSMNRGRDSFVPPMIVDGKLKNLGAIWAQELSHREAEISMEAVVALYTGTSSEMKPRPVTPKDFTEMIHKIEKDRRAAVPALEESQYRRKPPAWIPGKLLALARRDGRAWPEQKPGYDTLQRSHPTHRTYVWSEQELITNEDREQYINEALALTADEFEAVYDEVFGSVDDPIEVDEL